MQCILKLKVEIANNKKYCSDISQTIDKSTEIKARYLVQAESFYVARLEDRDKYSVNGDELFSGVIPSCGHFRSPYNLHQEFTLQLQLSSSSFSSSLILE
jgi:hypothetical protein